MSDGVAETPLARLTVTGPHGPAVDGTASLLIRPEQVRATGPAEGREALVRARSFAGSHTRVIANIGDLSLELHLAGGAGSGDWLWLAVEGSGLVLPG